MVESSSIWTAKFAYAIGLLATDGNLSPDGRHISLTSSDTEQLIHFQACLGTSVKLAPNPPGSFTRNPNYRVQIGNRKLYRRLQDMGLTSRKTASLSSLKIPPEFFRDFLRGVIDGDGSIIVYNDRYRVYKTKRYQYLRLYVAVASSSHAFLDWIHRTLQHNLSVRGSLVRQPPKRALSRPMWKLRFAKNDSITIIRWMYYDENVPRLTRKWIRAEQALKTLEAFRDQRFQINRNPTVPSSVSNN